MIRLDAISIVGLPQRDKADISGPYVARVNCVLHSGPLSARQELDVRVNGAQQTGVREGNQQVFSWQLLRTTDRVDLVLRCRGVPTKRWQASWNERDAIVHHGTAPIQVFLDGKLQPPTEGTGALISLVSGNGSMQAATSRWAEGAHLSVMAVAQTTEAVPQDQETTRPQNQRHAREGDMLTDAQEEKEEQWEEEDGWKDQWEEEDGSDEAADEARWEEELEGDEGDDDGSQWEDEEDEEDQREMDAVTTDEGGSEDAAPLLVEREGEAVGAWGHRGTQLPPADEPLSAIWQVATVHANQLAQEQALASLQELVALRPKTLIVDVRPGSPQRKKHRPQDPVSKQVLRLVFGAKYWDRGWAIPCTSQMVPRSGGIRGISWRYSVNLPESHPDGIPSLVQKLTEGYALVVIDSLTAYGESRRRAVVEELQQRVAGLALGPLD